jgi:hypothetical protein
MLRPGIYEQPSIRREIAANPGHLDLPLRHHVFVLGLCLQIFILGRSVGQELKIGGAESAILIFSDLEFQRRTQRRGNGRE